MGNNIQNEYTNIIPEISNNKLYNKENNYSETSNLKNPKNEKLIKRKNINYNLRAVFFIIMIILFFLLRTLYFRICSSFTNDDDDEDENLNPDKEAIYYKEKFDSYLVAFNKSKDFINTNVKGKLINNTIIISPKKPRISVVIPCQNCKNYILRCVRSIQNQNYTDFEIVIVDDGSENDTLLYLEKLQKEDQRIKIISNKMNMGIFYSRAVGTFSSRGKYIFVMDGDDMYLDEYVLWRITNIASKGNFDIIVFKSIITDLKPNVYEAKVYISRLERGQKPNLVLFQPYLGYFPILPQENIERPIFNEIFIHAKCIKTKVYQKALNKYGEQRYLRYMVGEEDVLANYIIFNTAQVAKFVPLYGYIYMNTEKSSSKTQRDRVIFAIYFIYVFDAMIDFSLDLPRNKKVLVNFILFILNNKYLREALNSNDYNNNLFISCLDRFFNCSLISNENKNYVAQKGKYLPFINYTFPTFNISVSKDDLI